MPFASFAKVFPVHGAINIISNKLFGPGSFCMYEKIFIQMENLSKEGAELIPIFSDASQTTDCRFGKAEEFIKHAEACICWKRT